MPSTLCASALKNNIHKQIIIAGYLITVKHTSTYKGERMYFGTFIDKEGQWIDTVHFPQSAAQYPFIGPGIYEMHGTVIDEYDFISIDVSMMKRLDYVDRE